MKWESDYRNKKMSIDDAAGFVKSGDLVLLGPIAGFPLEIVNAITARNELQDIRFLTGLIMTLPDFLVNDDSGRFTYLSVYMGPVERMFYDHGGIEPFSIHFSQAVNGTRGYQVNLSVLEVSPPDPHGYMCIGPGSSFMGKTIYRSADKVVVQVNPNVPYFQGSDMHIHVSEVDAICEVDRPLFELPDIGVDPVQSKIAEIVSERVNDGDTIQLGFGRLANAIGDQLLEKKDLGIHTEFLTPSMIELYRQGVANGTRKTIHPEKMIAAFCVGKKEDYDFLNQNAAVEFHPAAYVNDTQVIRKNDNFISVNNALAVDLTGQVASESMGFRQFSGTGGQVDFVRGARLAKGGKTFIALKSTTTVNGETISRIPAAFAPGTIVTTPRSDVQYIATEYGVAEIEFSSIPERVNKMIQIAHPDFRESLAKEAVDGGLIKAEMINV